MVKVDTLTLIRKAVYIYIYIKKKIKESIWNKIKTNFGWWDWQGQLSDFKKHYGKPLCFHKASQAPFWEYKYLWALCMYYPKQVWPLQGQGAARRMLVGFCELQNTTRTLWAPGPPPVFTATIMNFTPRAAKFKANTPCLAHTYSIKQRALS